MNTRTVDQQTANDVVRESLGLSADDLGMNAPEDAFTNDDNDTGINDDNDDLDGAPDSRNDNNQPETRQEQDQDDFLTQPEPQPAPQPQPQQRQIPQSAEVRSDAKGNIIDKKTGQIVARAGKEARLYQGMHRARQERDTATRATQEVTERLNKAVEIGTQLFERLKEMQTNQGDYAPERYNLNRNEAIEALNFAKEAKSDPVGTIKKLLTRAATNGIDLSSIGLAGGNFDPKSLMDLVRSTIDERMTPLRERTQRESDQEKAQREAQESRDASTKELNTFLQANPEARQFLPAFHQVYSQPQFQHMSLNEVWSRIQLNLLRREQQQQQQRPPNQQRNRNRNSRPPSGQSRPPASGNSNGMAPVDMSYEDIVRGLIPSN